MFHLRNFPSHLTKPELWPPCYTILPLYLCMNIHNLTLQCRRIGARIGGKISYLPEGNVEELGEDLC